MCDFQKRLANAGTCASLAGRTGAAIGGSVVSAVCAFEGRVVGPAGTFFGAKVGQGAGAVLGGAVGGFLWC